jgi:DNA-binding IclR family transcriptional regulator
MVIGSAEGVVVTRAVDRAARILLALGSGPPRLGVSEIADLVDVPKPTVYTMLRTLERHALVAQETGGGKYGLGPAVLRLGNAYLDGSELRARSTSWADRLARQTGEAVWVGVRSGADILVVHHALRPDDLAQILELGAAIPWHTCALGHAIVSWLDDEARDSLLARLIGPAAVDPAALAGTRRRAYAVEEHEATPGDAGIAAPVFDRSGRVVGALGVVGPTARLLAVERRDRLIDAVRATAKALSRDLGGITGRR